LPDYQGIGLGTKFLECVAKYYTGQGFDVSIRTSAKNLVGSLRLNSRWCMTAYNISNCSSSKSAIDYKRTSMRNRCYAATFFYIDKK